MIETEFFNKSIVYTSMTSLGLFLLWTPFLPWDSSEYILPACLLTIVLFGLLLQPLIYQWLRGSIDLFHPIVFINVVYFLPNYVAKGIYLIQNNWSYGFNYHNNVNPYYHILSLVIFIIAYLMLVLGYHLFLGERISKLCPKIPMINDSYKFLPWLLFIIFLLMFFVRIVLSQETTAIVAAYERPYETSYQLIIECGSLAFFLLAYLNFRKSICSVNTKRLFYLATAIIVLSSLLSSSRHLLLMNGLLVIGAFQYSRGRGLNRRQFGTSLLIGVVLLLIGITIGTQNRMLSYSYYGRVYNPTLSNNFETLTDSTKIIARQSLTYLGENAFDRLITRLVALETLIKVLEIYPESLTKERALGIDNNLFYDFFWGIIPRFIYPDKPILESFSRKFGQIYWGASTSVISYAAITPIVDLYRNGGILAVIIGMLVLGLTLRLIREYFIGENTTVDAGYVLFYIFIIIRLRWALESTFASFFNMGIRYGIMILLFILTINIFGRILEGDLRYVKKYKGKRFKGFKL